MSVRGTTHARVQKRIINNDRGGTYVCCAWDECDNDGFELYKVRMHEHAQSVGCDSSLAKHITYVFCTERHKQYFLACTGAMAHDTQARNRGRIAGMLPPGMKRMVG